MRPRQFRNSQGDQNHRPELPDVADVRHHAQILEQKERSDGKDDDPHHCPAHTMRRAVVPRHSCLVARFPSGRTLLVARFPSCLPIRIHHGGASRKAILTGPLPGTAPNSANGRRASANGAKKSGKAFALPLRPPPMIASSYWVWPLCLSL